jgi:single-strand DNA-binding protein
MANLNVIFIAGNCGGDPEMRFTPEGTPVTTFNVAVDNGRFVGNEWKEATDWFRIITFGKLAERVNERVAKGNPVLVSGKLKLNRWEDKNTGEKRASLEILANKVISFSRQDKQEEVAGEGDIEPTDIPF